MGRLRDLLGGGSAPAPVAKPVAKAPKKPAAPAPAPAVVEESTEEE